MARMMIVNECVLGNIDDVWLWLRECGSESECTIAVSNFVS